MTTIKIEDREYKMPTGYDELNWKIYVDLLNIEEKRDTYLVPDLFMQRYLEILCGVKEGEFDDLEYSIMAELDTVIKEGFNADLLKDIHQSTDHFVINGVTYSFYCRNTIGGITFGEKGYIEEGKRRSLEMEDAYGYLPNALATLIRPATKITTKEGLVKWKLDRFDPADVEHRAKLLIENLKLLDLIMVHNFFLNGRNKS